MKVHVVGCIILSKKDWTRGICGVCPKMKLTAQQVIARECEGNRTHFKVMVCDRADCNEMALSNCPVRSSVPHKAENILASRLTICFSTRTLLNKRGHSVATLFSYFVQHLQNLNLFKIVHIGGPTITH
jgi:hypothetical protein